MSYERREFTAGPQTTAQVEHDLTLMCCDPSLVIGGFVACVFHVRDAEKREWVESFRWALPMFADGRFVMLPHLTCPFCKRQLPVIQRRPERDITPGTVLKPEWRGPSA